MAPQVRTFAQFYSEAANNPSARNYARIMERFDPAHPDAPDSMILHQQVVNSGERTPQAYLCCIDPGTGPCIYCFHFPSKYINALDGTATQWDDRSFAFLGDLVQGLITTAVFPDNAFKQLTVQTYSSNHFLQHLDDLEPTLPPVPVADAAEEVQT